jgi:hypothetical protein
MKLRRPASTQLLLESPGLALRITLERLRPGTGSIRKTPGAWEEICVFDSQVHNAECPLDGTYRCLPPGVPMPGLRAETVCLELLRATYSGSCSKSRGFRAAEKPFVAPIRFADLLWNEVPPRRPNDPGGRVAELSRDPSGLSNHKPNGLPSRMDSRGTRSSQRGFFLLHPRQRVAGN